VVRDELEGPEIRAELELLADQHRGEAVLVVSHGEAIRLGVPALARNLSSSFPEGRAVPSCGVVELEADADGWQALSWCGEPVPTR
jgi:2,3-bisphosphoglycerate-dependent phosphoglycerate mutase